VPPRTTDGGPVGGRELVNRPPSPETWPPRLEQVVDCCKACPGLATRLRAGPRWHPPIGARDFILPHTPLAVLSFLPPCSLGRANDDYISPGAAENSGPVPVKHAH